MRKLLFIVLFVAIPAFASDPCTGLIQDKLDHPTGAAGQIARPAAGASYTDPVFGTTITRITNANGTMGQDAVIIPLYNTMRGWNSDGTQIILWKRNASGLKYYFYQGDKPYAFLGEWAATTAGYPNDLEQIMWSTTDPNVLYFPALSSSGSQARLMKLTLNWPSAPSISTVRDFATECNAAGVTPTLSLGTNPHDLSGQSSDMTVGFECGGYWANTPQLQIQYSIARDQILFTRSIPNGLPMWAFPDGTGFYDSQSGKIFNNSGTQTGQVTVASNSYLEHQSLAFTNQGNYNALSLYDNTTAGKVGTLMSYRLDQASPSGTSIIGTSNGYPFPWHDTHPSLSAGNGSGWVAVGQLGTGYGNSGPLDNEIVLANIYSGTVCRLAHARSYADTVSPETWTYWGETHPQISADGYRIMFGSDWEGGDSVNTYLIDLRAGPNPNPTPTPSPTPPPTLTFQAVLTWTDNSTNETGFRIERGDTNPPLSYHVLGTVGAGVTTYTDGPIPAGANYCWHIVAFNANGDANPSPDVCALAPIPPPPVPNPASGLQVSLVPSLSAVKKRKS